MISGSEVEEVQLLINKPNITKKPLKSRIVFFGSNLSFLHIQQIMIRASFFPEILETKSLIIFNLLETN